MRLDGLKEVRGAAIVQEEDSLAQAPQRSAAELVPAGAALRTGAPSYCGAQRVASPLTALFFCLAVYLLLMG